MYAYVVYIENRLEQYPSMCYDDKDDLKNYIKQTIEEIEDTKPKKKRLENACRDGLLFGVISGMLSGNITSALLNGLSMFVVKGVSNGMLLMPSIIKKHSKIFSFGF